MNVVVKFELLYTYDNTIMYLCIFVNYYFVCRNIDKKQFFALLLLKKSEIAMVAKNYFISGITEMLILYFLKQKDCYVYEITKTITDFSEGDLSISQNTIYTATYKLESEGMISEYARLVGRKRTRVYYHVEPEGLRYLEELLSVFRSTFTGIEKILTKNIEENEADEPTKE